MQVDNDLEAMVPSPSYSFLKVGKLAGDVWFARADFERPVSDRDTDMVQSNSG